MTAAIFILTLVYLGFGSVYAVAVSNFATETSEFTARVLFWPIIWLVGLLVLIWKGIEGLFYILTEMIWPD